jgi:hypothetical protein
MRQPGRGQRLGENCVDRAGDRRDMAGMSKDGPTLRRQPDPGESVVQIGKVRDLDACEIEETIAITAMRPTRP